MRIRATTAIDGYKVGHAEMYADGTETISTNLTPRHNKIYLRNATQFYDGKVVWIGAQGSWQEIVEIWEDTFFKLHKEKAISQFRDRVMGYIGSEVKTIELLGELHDIGYLPLKVKTIREGSRVPTGIPVMSISNTIKKYGWLVNFLETILSSLVWKISTNATIAAEFRAICEHFGRMTGVDKLTIAIQCHDFSLRGMSGIEDGARSGFGHLASFIGTDTLPAIDYAEDYYDSTGLIGVSVPATEHSVSSNNINFLVEKHNGNLLEAEKEFMVDLITRKFPRGIVSYVSDTYDFWGVVTEVLPSIKDVITSRESNGVTPGKLVIRPDSGDPVEIICGTVQDVFETIEEAEEEISYRHQDEATEACSGAHCRGPDKYETDVFVKETQEYYRITTNVQYNRWDKTYYFAEDVVTESQQIEPTPEMKGSVQCLWETFGGTITETGYKLLDSHIGLIYGDSITRQRAVQIFTILEKKGFASGNVVLGIGSYTYQMNSRDTLGFALKATNSVVNGKSIALFKDPKTDQKKKSAKGLLFVGINKDGEFYLEDQVSEEREDSQENQLKTIYDCGKFVYRTNLQEIRETLHGSIV